MDSWYGLDYEALDKLISNVKGYQDQVNSYASAENEQNEINNYKLLFCFK